MKSVSSSKLTLYFPALFVLCLSLTGCSVVKGIFKAGVWVGVLSVVVILGLMAFGVSRLRR